MTILLTKSNFADKVIRTIKEDLQNPEEELQGLVYLYIYLFNFFLEELYTPEF